jgi:RNA polymerase sigma-70 factor (ECF subfamily)
MGARSHDRQRDLNLEAEVISWPPQPRRYARALTGDSAWADHLVQDTAERVLARSKGFWPAGC